jgi:hypothetical protein
MNSTSWKDVAEIVGIAAIVASLILVAYELRQNTAVTTAQAVFDLNTSVDSAYRARAQDPALDTLIDKGHSDPGSLSERDRSQFAAWLRADMNLIEAVWFHYDKGIIPQRHFDGYINAACSRITTPGGQEYWTTEAKFFARDFRKSIAEWCS